MTARTLLVDAAGRPLVTDDLVNAPIMEILLETFGILSGLTVKMLGREVAQGIQQELLTRIAVIAGKERLEAKYRGLQVMLPGEEPPPRPGPRPV